VSRDFGVQFGYYALLNYTAFRDAVNAVGGVTVDIESPNASGLYDPNANLRLPNGTVKLNGQQALDLSRARGEGYGSYGFVRGDFDRTSHQQQLLLALKDKAASASVVANPVKVSDLADALGKNVKTDMSVGEMQTLLNKTKTIQDANITKITLNDVHGQNLLMSYRSYNGQSALIPAAGINNYAAIKQAVATELAPKPAAK
jgi:anionic cell wall polymer biosynthesis LytR-Cps2A-Psr (LCP) family protein